MRLSTHYSDLDLPQQTGPILIPTCKLLLNKFGMVRNEEQAVVRGLSTTEMASSVPVNCIRLGCISYENGTD